MPNEPGSGVTLLLARSSTLTVLFGFPHRSVAKTIFCPSGDQVGSISGSLSLGRRRRASPPCEETIHIAAGYGDRRDTATGYPVAVILSRNSVTVRFPVAQGYFLG